MISTQYDTTTANTQTSTTKTADKATGADKEMFLQLLVAQIKNQNPLSPTDGVQFLTQLAQFSELEQLTGMRADISAVRADLDNKATQSTQS